MMRFIDHLLAEPIVDTLTGKVFDKEILLSFPPASFVVDNVAKQLIEDIEQTEDHPTKTGRFYSNEVQWTAIGKELLFGYGGSLKSIVAAIPPYETCFFEYRPPWKVEANTPTLYEGVWFLSGPEFDRLFLADAREEDPETEHVVLATVFCRYLSEDGFNIPINDCQGRAQIRLDANYDMVRLVPDGRMPNRKELLVALASLMLMGTKIASAEQSTTPPPSRKEIKKARRTGNPLPKPGLRFWTLKLNVPGVATDGAEGGHHDGGWTVAWHRVRGHLRHLKSGKVVKVRPHTKGDPLKGIVVKDYTLAVKE